MGVVPGITVSTLSEAPGYPVAWICVEIAPDDDGVEIMPNLRDTSRKDAKFLLAPAIAPYVPV